MTVSNSVIAGFDDVSEVSLAVWGTRIILSSIKGQMPAFRFEGGALGTWNIVGESIPSFKGGKSQLATTVAQDQLIFVWHNNVTGFLMLARYNLLTQSISLNASPIVLGESPAVVVYGGIGLLMAYTRGGVQYALTSNDALGDQWVSGPLVEHVVNTGNSNIHEVDIDTTNPAGTIVFWTETDSPP